jgi:hypothetical protein
MTIDGQIALHEIWSNKGFQSTTLEKAKSEINTKFIKKTYSLKS